MQELLNKESQADLVLLEAMESFNKKPKNMVGIKFSSDSGAAI